MRHGAVDLNVDRRCRVGAIDHAAGGGSDDDHNFALGRETLRVAGRRVGAEENYCVGLRRVEAAGVKSAQESVALGLSNQFTQHACRCIGLGTERARVIAAIGRENGQLGLLAAVVVNDRDAIVGLDQQNRRPARSHPVRLKGGVIRL